MVQLAMSTEALYWTQLVYAPCNIDTYARICTHAYAYTRTYITYTGQTKLKQMQPHIRAHTLQL